MKKVYLFGCGFLLLIASYFWGLFRSPDEKIRHITEGSFIEILAPIFWFIAAIILFFIFLKSKSNNRPYFLKTKRNIFYLLLGLIYIFCCGEEISWGQQIFGWETTEIFQKDNAQQETNIHNLWIFQGYDRNLNEKVGFQRWYTSARIFSIFWFLYSVLVPIMNENSIKAQNFFGRIYFPVIPLWISILFLMNYIISRVLAMNQFKIPVHSISEIQETNFAFLFFIASISLYYLHKLLINNIQVK